MLNMPFNEALYQEIAAFFSEQATANVLLLGMEADWKERFKKDFADRIFQAVPWDGALPEAWQGSFSLIVLAPGIEESLTPESLLESLQPFLATCGYLIVPFRNPWHWSVFYSWFTGKLRYGTNPLLQANGQFFSFPEILRLSKLAHYEDFTVRQLIEEGSAKIIQKIKSCGVSNEKREIETSWWIIRFAALHTRTVRLKERYSENVRRLLARLLHRLENGIEAAATLEALRRLLSENEIDDSYLKDFVANTAADAFLMCSTLRREGLLR